MQCSALLSRKQLFFYKKEENRGARGGVRTAVSIGQVAAALLLLLLLLLLPGGAMAAAAEASVRVFTRFRPLNKREAALGVKQAEGFLTLTDSTIKLPQELMQREVTFDQVFRTDSTQPQVYDAVARATVADVMAGFNGTIFAYGQTGAGKSWSMMGPDNLVQMMGVEGFDDSQRGIIPRATAEIFEKIFADERGVVEYTVRVSYLEVYREVIRDLLDPNKKRLEVREHVQTGIYVDGLTEEWVTHVDEVLDVLKRGDAARAVASTQMNAASSRSHSVFTMKVTQKETDATTQGQLNLVDLAGSEKIGARPPPPPQTPKSTEQPGCFA